MSTQNYQNSTQNTEENNSQTNSDNLNNLQGQNSNSQSNSQNGEKSNKFYKNNPAKQFFYYLVLISCIFALSIAGFTFLRSNLIRFVFPSASDSYYRPYPGEMDACKYKNNYSPYSVSPTTMSPMNPSTNSLPTEPIKPELNSPEEVKACEKKILDDKNAQVNIDYQRDMLNSTLTIIITAIILVVNVKFFKQLEF
jgi:hypothetical protein